MKQIEEEKIQEDFNKEHNIITQIYKKKTRWKSKTWRVWWCCLEKTKTWKNANKWKERKILVELKQQNEKSKKI